jgi:hypothetical protein
MGCPEISYGNREIEQHRAKEWDQPSGKFNHQSGSPGIANQANYKEDQMPGFEPARDSLAPHTDRIKN